MKLKTYQATSIDAALKLARIELGEEALFLGADEHEAESGAESDRRFHATFALAEASDSPSVASDAAEIEEPYWNRRPSAAAVRSAPSDASSRVAPVAVASAPKPGPVSAAASRSTAAAPSIDAAPEPPEPFERIRREIQELRRGLEAQATRQAPSFSAASALRYSRLALLYDQLTRRGVAPGFALELVAPLEASAEAGEGLAALSGQLRRRINDAWRVADGSEAQGPRILAFVGPAGAGKTTVIAKLAVRAARRGAPVRLLSVDQPRIGASQTLELFADLIDARVSVIEELSDLAEAARAAVRGESHPTVLIDTRGYGPDEEQGVDALAQALGAVDGLETHFVVHPGMHPSDLDRETSRYARCRPAAALFARLDDSSAPGAVWNVYRRLGAPVSYLAEGPNVPDDLRRATPALLANWVLPEEMES